MYHTVVVIGHKIMAVGFFSNAILVQFKLPVEKNHACKLYCEDFKEVDTLVHSITTAIKEYLKTYTI